MILSQIAALSENFALGKNNKLLWHYSEDLKYFKEMTLNKIMIMGRKTFDSLGKPLPKRFHIVISRQNINFDHPQVIFVKDVSSALDLAKKLTDEKKFPEEVMVIGGAEIYKQTLTQCDFLYLSRIPGNFEADVYYPAEFENDFGASSIQKSSITPDLRFEIWAKRQTFSQKK